MAGFTIQMTAQGQNSLHGIHRQIHQIVGAEQVSEEELWIGECHILLLVYEKYFFRSNSYATLTVLLTEEAERQTAHIVSTGGGGSIANVSYGANQKLMEECVENLEKVGFTIDQEHSDELPKGILKRFWK